jgi:hypothetical protein
MVEREVLVNSLIGKAVSSTDCGEWRGPMLNGAPVFEYLFNFILFLLASNFINDILLPKEEFTCTRTEGFTKGTA